MKEETNFDQTLVTEEFCESQVKQPRKVGTGAKIGAAVVAGAAVGSAATFGGQAVAANISTPEETASATDNANTNTAGAPVAQVNDDMSFSQAFASARQQVGAGGVFTWHGKEYGTYYKEEWDNMTAEEKADYQASVDNAHIDNTYITANHTEAAHENHADLAENKTDSDTQEEDVKDESTQDNAEVHEATTDSADVDVHVISVQHNVNMNGHDVDVAVIEVDGHNGILVDVDHDNEVEGAIIDVNDDGQVQQNEISPDLSNAHIQMPQMSDGDAYMAQNDGMPDYTNDANV